jgi:tetratricopeptide (TPR) repeat protein
VSDDSYNDTTYEDGPYEDGPYEDDPDEDDEFLVARRRRTRIQRGLAIFAVLAVVVAAVGSSWLGARQAQAEAERIEALLLRAEPATVAEAITAASALVASDRGRNAAFLGLDLRANLLYYGLYSGSSRLKRKAADRREDSRLRAPDGADHALSDAVWHALVGVPTEALKLLDSGAAGDTHPVWQRLARAEVARRTGQGDKAESLLASGADPLSLAWRLRSAWAGGDLEGSEQLSAKLLEAQPAHLMAEVVAVLAASRGESAEGAAALLAPLLESAQSMPNRLTAWVVVEHARVTMRGGSDEESRSRAAQLLDSARQADDPAPELVLEAAWLRLVNGRFGAARTLADKGLREQPDESSLLALYSAACLLNDSSEQISALLRDVPVDSSLSAGPIQARALAALVRGEAGDAVAGLRKTVHLGAPGQSRLFLVDALIQAGELEQAREQAGIARATLAAVYGARSREAALGAAYEGLALAALGDHEGAAKSYEMVLSGQNKTPWTAWLYGRTLQYAGEAAAAKDAFLLACHNGQDFARACWDLAEIYGVLKLDAVQRRTQSEAKRHYLRTSPNGWRADQLR